MMMMMIVVLWSHSTKHLYSVSEKYIIHFHQLDTDVAVLFVGATDWLK